MEQMNYRPNAQASNFARKRSENIIFLAVTETHTAFHNPHLFEILCGAHQKIRERKYNFSFIGSPDKETALKEAEEIIGRPPFSTATCWIDINNHVSGEMATRYLNGCGYSKIAFIGGPDTDEISRHRLKGFISTMRLLPYSVQSTESW